MAIYNNEQDPNVKMWNDQNRGNDIIHLEDADLDILGDYALYCNSKIELEEMPLSFEKWQIMENELN
jgi:hypothetical protein